MASSIIHYLIWDKGDYKSVCGGTDGSSTHNSKLRKERRNEKDFLYLDGPGKLVTCEECLKLWQDVTEHLGVGPVTYEEIMLARAQLTPRA